MIITIPPDGHWGSAKDLLIPLATLSLASASLAFFWGILRAVSILALVVVGITLYFHRKQRVSRRDKATAVTAVICVVTCGILITPVIWPSNSPSSAVHPPLPVAPTPLSREELMLGKLTAGDDYSKLRDIVGTDPDKHFTVDKKYTVYQFNRQWEYIDLLTDNGTVASLGVYAKSPELRAVLYAGGFPVTINGPSIARQTASDGTPFDGTAFCGTGGDSQAWLFEDFILSESNKGASFALGWSESTVAIRGTAAATLKVPDPACGYPDGGVLKCLGTHPMYTSSQTLIDCMRQSGSLAQVNKFPPSAVVINEPYHAPIDQLLTVTPSSYG